MTPDQGSAKEGQECLYCSEGPYRHDARHFHLFKAKVEEGQEKTQIDMSRHVKNQVGDYPPKEGPPTLREFRETLEKWNSPGMTEDEYESWVDSVKKLLARLTDEALERDEKRRELVVWPEKPAKQVTDSDCFNACLASLTGITLSEFPVLYKDTYENLPEDEKQEVGTQQDNECLQVLREHGWMWQHSYQMAPKGWSIGSGKSPRGDWWHSVLCFDGKPEFDPYESNDMLAEPVQDYRLLYQLVTPAPKKD